MGLIRDKRMQAIFAGTGVYSNRSQTVAISLRRDEPSTDKYDQPLHVPRRKPFRNPPAKVGNVESTWLITAERDGDFGLRAASFIRHARHLSLNLNSGVD